MNILFYTIDNIIYHQIVSYFSNSVRQPDRLDPTQFIDRATFAGKSVDERDDNDPGTPDNSKHAASCF